VDEDKPMGELSPWHLLIVAVVFVLLFGAKRLPDSARAIGRSLRIFKAETQGLREDNAGPAAPLPAAQSVPATALPAEAVVASAAAPPASATSPESDQGAA
jgi:sec-independent protein translocase protein TatA